jgi:hypothetical protein
MKDLKLKIKEYKFLKSKFTNVYLCYNFETNKYINVLFSKEIIKKFENFELIK